MEKSITERLKGLIEAGKWDDVKVFLSESFGKTLSSKDRGEVYAQLIALYFDIATKINKAHAAKLDEILTGLKQIQTAQNAVNDEFKLMQVKDKMKKVKE